MSVPNIQKLFQYLQCFSIDPIKFEDQIVGEQIYQLYLNSKLFYNDLCKNCGGCDPAESNIYTLSEYQKIMSAKDSDFEDIGLDPKYLHLLRQGLHSREVRINDELVTIWEYTQELNELYLPTREKILNRCTWCFQDQANVFKCRIHPVESITCAMPHLRVFHKKGSHRASIGISQFGRNWALKCPVSLSPPKSSIEFENNKASIINKLQILNQVGLDLNIETQLPKVIDVIDRQKFGEYQGVTLQFNPQSKKLF